MTTTKQRIAGLFTTLLCFCSGPALAYSEDICNRSGGHPDLFQVENCWDLQCQDDGDGGLCGVQGVLEYLQATALADEDTPPARSTLHFDLVWMMARVAGFSTGDALVVAAHSQATDVVQYRHRHADPARDYESLSLPGLDRWNLRDGFWIHYPPRSGDPDSAPRTDDGDLVIYRPQSRETFGTHEAALNHVRQWAFGQRSDLCKFGLTDGDGDCRGDTPIWIRMATVGGLNFPVPSSLGRQPLNPEQPGLAGTLAGKPQALGIYLHALGDRLSHFYCVQQAFLERERGLFGPRYRLEYPGKACGQVRHAMMHHPETGHGQVPPRTTNAMTHYLNELTAWLDTHPSYRHHPAGNMPGNGAVNQVALMSDIKAALEQGGAAQRMAALCLASINHGLGWHDGNFSCQYKAPR